MSVFDHIPTSINSPIESEFFPVPRRRKRKPISLTELLLGGLPKGFYPTYSQNVMNMNPAQYELPPDVGGSADDQYRRAEEANRFTEFGVEVAAEGTNRHRPPKRHFIVPNSPQFPFLPPDPSLPPSPSSNKIPQPEDIKKGPGQKSKKTRRSKRLIEKRVAKENAQENSYDSVDVDESGYK